MCIIIYNASGKLDSKLLQTASQANPDGAGLMYAVNGNLQVFKNRKNGKTIDMYYKVRKTYPTVPIVLHFRISTDGLINDDNCHPYIVNRHTALCHNGILSKYTGRKTKKSDTRLFIDELMAPIPNEVIWSDAYMTLVEHGISYGNKFVIMNDEGDVRILNESLGHWDKKKMNWFSNKSYVESNYSYVYPQYQNKWHENKFNTLDLHECSYCQTPLYGCNEIARGTCNVCNDYLVEFGKD